MRMRQSLAEFEEAFVDEIDEDRHRRERLRAEAEQRTRRRRTERTRRQAVQRSRQRQVERVHKHGKARFWVLVLVLLATAVLVTVAMFETLYYVMG
jgi:membrane glycosyltransferase